jgi:hypothetical protein
MSVRKHAQDIASGKVCLNIVFRKAEIEDYLKSNIIDRATDFGNVERQETLVLDPQVRETFA